MVNLEGYELGDVIGRGSDGVVYAARDPEGHEVAVKICSRPDVDPLLVQRAADYLKARTVGLDHRNLVRVHDVVVTAAGDVAIVMERTAGGTAARLLRAGPLPVHVALDIGIRIADALDTAHRETPAVLHGRVTPHNILIRHDGEPALADLGLATLLPGNGSALWPYVAPEQLDDLPASPRTDVYGLGCTLYALLAGRPPCGFPEDTGVEDDFRQRVLRELPQELRRFDLPPHAEVAIVTALAKDPHDRFASAAAMRDELAGSRTVHRASVDETAEAAPAMPHRASRRRSATPAVIALALVVALIIAVVIVSALNV